ncbi:MAG TPA: glutaredoxin family protein [Solirubrobacteraceae bacterium]|jgi:glutaredoxin|nr:glutaredoxin family protein [Solirubrobacteraceae bacterium]
MTEHRVTLYGRPGCHLCDEARTVLERVRQRQSFELQEQNIEADEQLLRRYLERIPVVAIDGRDAFDLFVDEAAFERALQAPQPA